MADRQFLAPVKFNAAVKVADSLFTLQDDSDATKQVQFQLSGITTATTRTLTVPDVSDTVVMLGATQTLTAKTLTAPVLNSPTGLVAADIPALPASQITSGVIGTARHGSGTANATTFLRGDQTWQTIASGGDVLAANNLSEYTATQATARSNIGAAPTASPTFTGTLTAAATSVGTLAATDTITITDAKNIVLDTTTGTKIGTATTQKLGFFNATPVAQQANSVDLGTVLSNFGLRASGAVFPLSMAALSCTSISCNTITITDGEDIVLTTNLGTQIGTATSQKVAFLGATPVARQANTVDLATVLSNFGFRASGGNPPLNLGTGALTAGSVLASSTGGVGYATGAGGTVTQITSRTTTVVLNTLTGTITLFSTTLAADTDVSFTWTNSTIAATDVVVTDIKSGAAVKGGYSVNVICGSGTATVTVHNHTPTITATEAPVISFVVIKGVTS